MAKMDLIAAFEAATEDDLADVRGRIATLEGQMKTLTKIERALASRFDDAPPKPPGRPKAARAVPSLPKETDLGIAQRRRTVAMYLMANGRQSQPKLAEACGISTRGTGCLTQVINHEWFHVTPDGVVTITGRGEEGIRKTV